MAELDFHASHGDEAAEDIAKLSAYFASLKENDSYTLEEKMSKLDEFAEKIMNERFGSEREILFMESEASELGGHDKKEDLILKQLESLRDNDFYTLEEKMSRLDEFGKRIVNESFEP